MTKYKRDQRQAERRKIRPRAPGTSTNPASSFTDRPVRDQLLALHSQYFQMRHSMLESIRETMQNNHLQTTRAISSVLGNINRLAMAAPFGRIQGGGNTGEGGVDSGNTNNVVSLSPTPRSLYRLWDKYTVGIGGLKTARLFTHSERGRVKHSYCHRNAFWDMIDKLVCRGITARSGCN